MFSTLDRHIAKLYLFNIAALLVLLFSFVVTVDVVLNIDRFLKAAEEIIVSSGDTDPSSLRRLVVAVLVICDLWWPRLLQLFTFLIGMVLVAAMGFTMTQMVRHREVVAILAGGISLRRVARPVLVVAALMLGLRAINQEFILPPLAPLLIRDPGDAGKAREWDAFTVLPTPDGMGRKWYAQKYDHGEKRLTGVLICEYDDDRRVRRWIEAVSGTWKPADSAGDKPAGAQAGKVEGGWWELEDVQIVSGTMAGPGASRGSGGGGGNTVVGGQTTRLATMSVKTDLDPTALLLGYNRGFAQSLSLRQTSSMLESGRLTDSLRQTLEQVRWSRLSVTLSTLLTLVITMPFFLTREPRNMLAQSLKAAPIGLAALIGGIIGSAQPVPGLPVWMGVMLPVLVLVPVSIAMTASMRT